MPILAGGLVFDATTRWFWTGLRWMVALLLLTPAIALVTVIGLQTRPARLAASTTDGDAASSAVQSGRRRCDDVGRIAMPVGPVQTVGVPLDPNTSRAARSRGFFSGPGSPARCLRCVKPRAHLAAATRDRRKNADRVGFGKTIAATTGAARPGSRLRQRVSRASISSTPPVSALRLSPATDRPSRLQRPRSARLRRRRWRRRRHRPEPRTR